MRDIEHLDFRKWKSNLGIIVKRNLETVLQIMFCTNDDHRLIILGGTSHIKIYGFYSLPTKASFIKDLIYQGCLANKIP